MKVAMVTGAGSGIGRACSIALSKAGYAMVLTGRTLSKLEETAKLLEGESLCVAADVGDAAPSPISSPGRKKNSAASTCCSTMQAPVRREPSFSKT